MRELCELAAGMLHNSPAPGLRLSVESARRKCYLVPMAESEPGQLTITEERGGFRHYLDGLPIHAGDLLEFFDPVKAEWLAARFELVAGQRGKIGYLCLPGGNRSRPGE